MERAEPCPLDGQDCPQDGQGLPPWDRDGQGGRGVRQGRGTGQKQRSGQIPCIKV